MADETNSNLINLKIKLHSLKKDLAKKKTVRLNR